MKDLVTHMVGVNEVWTASFTGARRGSPTRYFRSFDPVASPRRMVDAVRGWSRAETLDRYVATTAALAASLAGVDPGASGATATPARRAPRKTTA